MRIQADTAQVLPLSFLQHQTERGWIGPRLRFAPQSIRDSLPDGPPRHQLHLFYEGRDAGISLQVISDRISYVVEGSYEASAARAHWSLRILEWGWMEPVLAEDYATGIWALAHVAAAVLACQDERGI